MGFFLVLVFTASSLLALDINKLPPDNWAVPARSRGLTTMSDIHFPVSFVGITPCRIADTRNPAGPYGAPPLAAGVPRNFVLTGQCGIPAGAQSVSLNLTVTNTAGPGFILIYPAGGAQPTVSTLNYVAGQTVANAAIVPLGGTSVTVIAGVSGTDFIMDTNGYFPDTMNNNEAFNQVGNANGGIVFGANSNAGASPVSGVRGQLTATGTGLHAAGVFGQALATSGLVHGVFGKTNSNVNDNAGVYGRDNTALAPVVNVIGVSGVRGEGENGVIGLSSTNITEFGGVVGLMLNSTGNLGAFGGLGESFTTAVFGLGNLSVSGTKSFVEPHPTDASKMIDYVALEGPEAGTYFRGTARTVGGMAVIPVPDHFAMVTDPDGLTVQLTPVGSAASMYVVSEDLNEIVVHSNRDVKFHYQVNGIRTAFKDHQPIVENTMFNPRSPTQQMSGALSEEQRRRLIANGTFNADGSVNLETARAMGWAKVWEDRAKAVEAASKAPDPQSQ